MIGRLRRAAVAVLLAAVAACTRTGTIASAPSNTIRFAIAADPQTLDPLFAHADANSVEQQLARLAFEPFIDIDAHGRPYPSCSRASRPLPTAIFRATDARSSTTCAAACAGKTAYR